jgi:predicted transposase/invertase (TIGR01784 family)
MATEILSKTTQDEIEYARMTTLLKSELDWQSRETHARRSGREEEKMIIAKNLLAKGSTPEFVQEITGLSLEEISQLQV